MERLTIRAKEPFIGVKEVLAVSNYIICALINIILTMVGFWYMQSVLRNTIFIIVISAFFAIPLYWVEKKIINYINWRID